MMNFSSRTLLLGLGAFVGAGVIAFFAGQSIGSDSTPPSVAPTIITAEPVITPIPLSPDDDVAAFAVEYAAQELASREIASDLEVVLDPGPPGEFGIGVSSPVPGPTPDPPEPVPDPEPEEPIGGPPAGDTPATETVEDACADGGEHCPEGVGGTVLAAIRTVPPLRGVTYFTPREEARYHWEPTCPAIEVPSGAAYFGTSSSRPVTIDIRYHAGRWTGDSYEVEGTFSLTTPDAAEGPWNDWIADESAADDDPRSWITHCYLIEGLPPRGDYMAFVDYTDKHDPSVAAINWPYRVDFEVLLDSGFLPGELRSPTFLLGHGIDELLIGVTARPDHAFHAVALQDAPAGSCDTGGDEASVLGRTDILRSAVVSDTLIPAERIEDPEYPYLPDHTRSLVHRLDLQEGSDYIVCLYWTERGTSFDFAVVDISEEVPVSTPEAYRPRILVHGFTGLFGSIGNGRLTVSGCGTMDFEIEPFTSADTSQMFDEPVELCVGEKRLTTLDRGLRVITAIEDTFDGQWRSGGRWIRTDLECDPAPCLLRLDEFYPVPFPEVPTERRLCGTGFGGGCDGEVPMRSAGSVALEVEYLRTPGNGLTEWSIGVVSEFEDSPPPPVGDVPRLDVQVTYELIGPPSQGARGTVRVIADREITLSVNPRNSPDCGFPNPDGVDLVDEFATEFTFQLEPLCLGNEYELTTFAFDRTRAARGTIVSLTGAEIGPTATFVVPPLLVGSMITTTIQAPMNDKRHVVYVYPVNISVPTVVPSYSARLGWTWPVADRARAADAGWQMFGLHGQANACGEPGARPFTVSAPSRSALYSQDQITITAVVDVHEAFPLGGAIVGECVPGPLVASHVMQATVTLEELMHGVTVTSDSGDVTFHIDGLSWRRNLVG